MVRAFGIVVCSIKIVPRVISMDPEHHCNLALCYLSFNSILAARPHHRDIFLRHLAEWVDLRDLALSTLAEATSFTELTTDIHAIGLRSLERISPIDARPLILNLLWHKVASGCCPSRNCQVVAGKVRRHTSDRQPGRRERRPSATRPTNGRGKSSFRAFDTRWRSLDLIIVSLAQDAWFRSLPFSAATILRHLHIRLVGAPGADAGRCQDTICGIGGIPDLRHISIKFPNSLDSLTHYVSPSWSSRLLEVKITGKPQVKDMFGFVRTCNSTKKITFFVTGPILTFDPEPYSSHLSAKSFYPWCYVRSHHLPFSSIPEPTKSPDL
jgi:hypothetical protein